MAETKMKQLQNNVLFDYDRRGEDEVAVFSVKRQDRPRRSREDLTESVAAFHDAF